MAIRIHFWYIDLDMHIVKWRYEDRLNQQTLQKRSSHFYRNKTLERFSFGTPL